MHSSRQHRPGRISSAFPARCFCLFKCCFSDASEQLAPLGLAPKALKKSTAAQYVDNHWSPLRKEKKNKFCFRGFDWLPETFEIAASTGLLAAIFPVADSQSKKFQDF